MQTNMSDEIHHVNPNCKDATRCFPHGEDGPVEQRPPPRWVQYSPYRKHLMDQYDQRQDAKLIAENAYGLVVVWDEPNQKDIPVICRHGGSMWLCWSCAGNIVDGTPVVHKPCPFHGHDIQRGYVCALCHWPGCHYNVETFGQQWSEG